MRKLFGGVLALAMALPVALAAVAAPTAAAEPALNVRYLSRYETGAPFGSGAAEIAAHDHGTQRLFVTNSAEDTIDVIDLMDVATTGMSARSLVKQIKVAELNLGDFKSGGATSVAVHPTGRFFAAALRAETKTDPGRVALFTLAGDLLAHVQAGALPDMLTFTPNGRFLLVANEGEPNDDYSVDPMGSVSIIDVAGGAGAVTQASVTHVTFEGVPVDGAVRTFGPNAGTYEVDLEPEYMTVDAASRFAYVTLQENNAIAVLDLSTRQFVRVSSLGYKDHSLAGNGLDASDKDGLIDIRRWPVLGMYMPDAIASYPVNGKTYLVTANEGDSRDYDAFSEESRVKDYKGKVQFNPALYGGYSERMLGYLSVSERLFTNELLGRLKVTNTMGDADGDGIYEALYSFGTRSFSIWDAESMTLVYDSGAGFERALAAMEKPYVFNADGDENSESRSDDKGPEPEGVVLGAIDGRTYAFIALERAGGFMVYDVTDPAESRYVTYAHSRDFTVDPTTGKAGDISPEGILFIPAAKSPTGKALVVAAHEMSGTIAVYELTVE